jgi:isochorismate synthase EntC
MIEQATMIQQIIYMVLAALIAGIGWLFQTVFKQNSMMIDKLIKIQETTTAKQAEQTQAILKLDNRLEQIHDSLSENNQHQKDIIDALKSQNIIDTRKIVLSRGLGLTHHGKKQANSLNEDTRLDFSDSILKRAK